MRYPSTRVRNPCFDGLEVIVELVYAPMYIRHDGTLRARSDARYFRSFLQNVVRISSEGSRDAHLEYLG